MEPYETAHKHATFSSVLCARLCNYSKCVQFINGLKLGFQAFNLTKYLLFVLGLIGCFTESSYAHQQKDEMLVLGLQVPNQESSLKKTWDRIKVIQPRCKGSGNKA